MKANFIGLVWICICLLGIPRFLHAPKKDHELQNPNQHPFRIFQTKINEAGLQLFAPTARKGLLNPHTNHPKKLQDQDTAEPISEICLAACSK